MLRDDAIPLVLARLSRTGDAELNSLAILEMDNIIQTELDENGRFTPWFLLSEDATAQTTAGEPRLPLPPDFIIEPEEGALWLYDVNDADGPWLELKKRDLDDIRREYNGLSGAPKVYAITGEYFIFGPTPDKSYTISMKYYANSKSIASANIENGWLKFASDLVIAKTTARLARAPLRDYDLAAAQDALAAQAMDRIALMHEARQNANRIYTMGGD